MRKDSHSERQRTLSHVAEVVALLDLVVWPVVAAADTFAGPVIPTLVLPTPQTPPAPPTPQASCLTDLEQAVLGAINQARAQRGLPPLQVGAEGTACARNHSADMARYDYFGHTDRTGRSHAQRLTEAGVPWTKCAECVGMAAGSETAVSDIVGAWLASPAHAQSILDAGLTEAGVGAAQSAEGCVFLALVLLAR